VKGANGTKDDNQLGNVCDGGCNKGKNKLAWGQPWVMRNETEKAKTLGALKEKKNPHRPLYPRKKD